MYKKTKTEVRARIVKPQLMYYGEVSICCQWRRVTSACFTKQGAMRELQKWKKKTYPEEFTL